MNQRKLPPNPLPQEEYERRLEPRQEDVRGAFFRDQTAVLHSLPFRRLKHKAQVFFSPNNDHVCTRIEHSLHVATVAETIARGLGLNGEMAYAIGLAHDLGHAPFGHAGETVLDRKSGGFIHEVHSLRVVDVLGNRGASLNLTYGVRDGILCHCGEKLDQELRPRAEVIDLSTVTGRDHFPCSFEGCVARMSDRIAYLGRDLEDAIYGGFIHQSDIPSEIADELGQKNGEIIDTLVLDVIRESEKRGAIALSDAKFSVLKELSAFSSRCIYRHPKVLRYRIFCERMIEQIFEYLIDLLNQHGRDSEVYGDCSFPLDRKFGMYLRSMKEIYEAQSDARIVTDYIAGMTDAYALQWMKGISLPEELSFESD